MKEDKKARYADLARRLAASKKRAAERRAAEEEAKTKEKEKEKGTSKKGAKNTKKRKKEEAPEKKNLVPANAKLTEQQKHIGPTAASKKSKKLQALLYGKERDSKIGLTALQMLLVKRIEKEGELNVGELCSSFWSREELAEARKEGTDLTRLIRNAIRLPKAVGIIAPAETRGKYVFVEWRKVPKEAKLWGSRRSSPRSK